MESRRVVITGMAPITPIGCGVEDFSKNMFDGKNGITKIDCIDTTGLKTKIAGQVHGFDKYTELVNPLEMLRMDRGTQFTTVGSVMAINDANINLDKEDKNRIEVVCGASTGAIHTLEKNMNIMNTEGPGEIDNCFIPMIMGNIMAAQIAIQHGITGKAKGVLTACATGNDCIGEAYNDIKNGEFDMAIAGSTDSSISPIVIAGFQKLRVVNTRFNDDPEHASRPFDKKRCGFVIGEGCGILFIEELEHALKRGAKIYAEIVGYASTTDAFSIAAPRSDGREIERCMINAIKSAGISPEYIQYMNAHGTGTKLNDEIETAVAKRIWEDKVKYLSISSTKSMTGHTLSASGAVECIATALAIQNDIVPPTINQFEKDEACDLDYTPNTKRERVIDYAISNSVGFGGHNASIVLKKYK